MFRTVGATSLRFARLLGVLMAVCGSLWFVPPSRAQNKTLKLAVPSVNEGLLPIKVAIDQGLFKAEGISVELINFRGGGPAVQTVGWMKGLLLDHRASRSHSTMAASGCWGGARAGLGGGTSTGSPRWRGCVGPSPRAR
jgi:hypothetical protein